MQLTTDLLFYEIRIQTAKLLIAPCCQQFSDYSFVLGKDLLNLHQTSRVILKDLLLHHLLLTLSLVLAILEAIDILVEESSGFFGFFGKCTVIDDHGCIILIDEHGGIGWLWHWW